MNQNNALIPTNEEMSVYQAMAKTATQSQLFNKIGGESGLLSIMLMARELGLAPMQAIMGGMNVIQGKVEISPRMMNTMIRRNGHRLEIIESTDQNCKIKGIRHDTKEEYVASFSLDDAKRAGLVRSGGGWEKYASDMLFARCISRLARRLFADVISTSYVEGEIDKHEEHSETVLKSTIEAKPDSVQPEVQMVEIKAKEMSLEEFTQKMQEKVGDKFSLLGLNHYLEHLEKEKQVPQQKIMEQALHPSLATRFCAGLTTWRNALNQPKEEPAEV